MMYLLFVFLVGFLFSCDRETTLIDSNSPNPATEDTAVLRITPNTAAVQAAASAASEETTQDPLPLDCKYYTSKVDYFDINEVYPYSFNCPTAVTKKWVDYYPYK